MSDTTNAATDLPVGAVDNTPVVVKPVETLDGDFKTVGDDARQLATDAERTTAYALAHISDVVTTLIQTVIDHLHAYHTGSPAIPVLTDLKASL